MPSPEQQLFAKKDPRWQQKLSQSFEQFKSHAIQDMYAERDGLMQLLREFLKRSSSYLPFLNYLVELIDEKFDLVSSDQGVEYSLSPALLTKLVAQERWPIFLGEIYIGSDSMPNYCYQIPPQNWKQAQRRLVDVSFPGYAYIFPNQRLTLGSTFTFTAEEKERFFAALIQEAQRQGKTFSSPEIMS